MKYRVRYRGHVEIDGEVIGELDSQGRERELLVDCDDQPLGLRSDGPTHVRVEPLEDDQDADDDQRHCPECGAFVEPERAGQVCEDCAQEAGDD